MKKSILLLLFLSLHLFAYKSYTVTIPPMKFFLQSIGQSKIAIKTIYEKIDYNKKIPNSHLRKHSFTNVYFTLGLEEEKRYVDYIKGHNSEIEVINVSKDIEKLLTKDGKENPYIWMDPVIVVDIAEKMLEVLIKNDPSNEEYFRSNFKTFLGELDKIFIRIKNALFYSQNAVYVFDEKWNYYLRRFDVRYYEAQRKVLAGDEFTEVLRKSQEDNIKYLLVDQSVSYSVYSSWKRANNMKVIKMDVYEYDWLSNLFVLAEKLSK